MNTGIQDAMSLAGVLADVLAGADEAALDSWAASRHASRGTSSPSPIE
jgi:2-polyprenyl-6-methoxyphenol hydroxylase-like FAD-dependent oxidoreductase